MMGLIKHKVKEVVKVDAASIAEKAGAAMSLNMVMLGVLSQKGQLPLSADILRETIKNKGKVSFREINLRAFNMGVEFASGVA